MIAMRIEPDARFAGAESYFATRPPPITPQDLIGHTCTNLRLPTYVGPYAWEFEKEGRKLRVRVEGQFVFDSNAPIRCPNLDGDPVAGAGAAAV